ncbi:hypothetical protein TNCV_619851 [Trichonephila clavipes]|nr:hypothetical protein TNCV_619851 [Trichonephila clavipes]
MMTDSASRRLSQRRHRTTTTADDRHLSLCARRNRTTAPAELRSSLTVVGIKVSRALKASRTWSLCEVTSHLRPHHVMP